MICQHCHGTGFVVGYESHVAPLDLGKLMDVVAPDVKMTRTTCQRCLGSGKERAHGRPQKGVVPIPVGMVRTSELIDTFPEYIRMLIRTTDVVYNEESTYILVANEVISWGEAEVAMRRASNNFDASAVLFKRIYAAARSAVNIDCRLARAYLESNGVVPQRQVFR